MRKICKDVFKYAELSESAQSKARDWYREGGLGYEWWYSVYGDSRTIAGLMGINIESINFSGFCSQGDGARFRGTYTYKAGSVKALRDYAPVDGKLHEIAESLRDSQRPEFYQLEARISYIGGYEHEFCTSISVTRDGYDAAAGPADAITEALRDFMQWIYSQLESEYEYLTSDESVAESIEANEYEFTEDGARYT